MKRCLLALSVIAVAGIAMAQAEWTESGLLTATIDGTQYEMHSYYTRVADDAADGIEDEAVREFAQQYAGTVQHTASFRYAEAIEMVGIVLAPATIWVSIGVRTDADQSVPGRIDIDFALDPETLELMEDQGTIRYFPESWDLYDYYGLTEGELVIDEITENDDESWLIRGRIAGLLTHQTGLDATHNPADALPFEAEFVIDPVGRR